MIFAAATPSGLGETIWKARLHIRPTCFEIVSTHAVARKPFYLKSFMTELADPGMSHWTGWNMITNVAGYHQPKDALESIDAVRLRGRKARIWRLK
jgi:hypothetical protein